jgi:hypothetical protein
MITKLQFLNPETGVRTTLQFPSSGGTHGHWHATQNFNTGLWQLQWAYREDSGTRYERPWLEHRGLESRKAAEALKRRLRAEGIEGWGGPPAPPEIP